MKSLARSLVLAAVLASTACYRSSGEGVCGRVAAHMDGGAAKLTASGDASHIMLGFGSVPLGQSASETLLFSNYGDCDMMILNVTTELSAVGFSVGISRGQKLVSGGAPLQIPVRFTPTTLGAEQAMILVSTDAPDLPTIELDLVGLGAPR
jgi:hypothetical protein